MWSGVGARWALVVAALAGSLSACAPTHYDLQPGQTSAGFAADTAKCQLVAQAMPVYGTGILGAVSAPTAFRHEYRLCMQALGYVEAPEAQPSLGTNSAIKGGDVDCSPPQTPAPDTLQLALTAQQDAAAGDGAAQWLLGALYLNGLGVPKDHDAGIKWIEAATRTIQTATAPGAAPDMELFAVMLNTAQQALPELVQRCGATWGIAQYKQQTRLLIQALGGSQ